MTPDTHPSPPWTDRLRAVLASPPPALARLVRVLTRVELVLATAALLIIFVLVLLQAGQRYLPIDGWPWTGELARFSLVWLTFLVAGVLVTTDSHISIEMIDMVPGDRLRRLVRVVSCLIVAAIGVGLCAEAWELMQTQGILKSPAMRMPMSWLYGISIIGFVSVVVRSLVAALTYAVLGVPEPTIDGLELATE
ncbi:TRAP transporter small permease [Nocardioides alpinus]|uniref:TRAP transporter small permease n=1 Tax=Nocardioides alpinus TaxID=748909 RepID=UPI0012FEB60E|nr:TRAP transporter small permease [Nocardioides alpinus]